MSKLQNFGIVFDRSGPVYEPGETVNGKVVFSLTEPKSVREVRIKIRGKARVYWAEGGGRYTRHYKRKEYYFRVINQLAVSETGDGGTITLLAGRHMYPFTFQLPANLPCSFEHNLGYIRYTVKAVLDRPWKFDHETISEFKILVPYDSSTYREFAKPILGELQEEFRNFFCSSAGIMKIKMNSPKSGFTPAEVIELKINYDKSLTGVDISHMKMKLIKHITFHAITKKRFEHEVLEEVYQTGPFNVNGETFLRLRVPPLPPSNLKHCSIIDVKYELAIIIHTSGLHYNMKRSYLVQLWDTIQPRSEM